MNFLAHLTLADNAPAAWIGSIMPDLVRLPREPLGLPEATVEAVRQHRRIDAFTDTHPIVARSKARLFAAHGRYSGILVDIFYDHFLAVAWERYHHEPLPRFAARVYAAMESHEHLLPTAMRGVAASMSRDNWLCTYASLDGIELTLRRLSRRLSQRFERQVELEPAVALLREQRAELAADFHEFFPELQAFASTPPAQAVVLHRT